MGRRITWKRTGRVTERKGLQEVYGLRGNLKGRSTA